MLDPEREKTPSPTPPPPAPPRASPPLPVPPIPRHSADAPVEAVRPVPRAYPGLPPHVISNLERWLPHRQPPTNLPADFLPEFRRIFERDWERGRPTLPRATQLQDIDGRRTFTTLREGLRRARVEFTSSTAPPVPVLLSSDSDDDDELPSSTAVWPLPLQQRAPIRLSQRKFELWLDITSLCASSAACRNCERLRPKLSCQVSLMVPCVRPELICRKAKHQRVYWQRQQQKDIDRGLVIIVNAA